MTAHNVDLSFVLSDLCSVLFTKIGVGKALAGRARASFFLTTKTVPCSEANIGVKGACYNQTLSDFETDLTLLGLDYVDLILLHGIYNDICLCCNGVTKS